MKRASTRRAMVDALTALDERAKFHAGLFKGLAASLKSTGLASEYINSATATDIGFWTIDDDGREVWRVKLDNALHDTHDH